MSAQHEMNRHALREHRESELTTLERVEAEALSLERLPEGEDPRPMLEVDGHVIHRQRGRIGGKLSIRW